MKKKIVFDMLLNIIATAIPLVVLQLFVLPHMAANMTDAKYGLLVTVVAFMNVIPSTFGNALNNIKLIFQNKYEDLQYKGDFNILLIALSIINIIAVIVFSILYKSESSVIGFLLTLAMSILWLARDYYTVAYRIKINYVFILINNLIMVLGYAIGYYLFIKLGYWQLVYLMGLVVSMIFILLTTDIWREPLEKTELIKEVSVQSSLLLISSFLNRVTAYADKLLIYPLLGGAVVAVYYSATIFGKIVSMMIGPISSVVLTYLAKMKTKSQSVFKQSFLLSLAFATVGYFVCVAISRPVLDWLYPQYVNEAMNYIYVTTASAIVTALISIVNPFIMKFFNMKWQIVISGINVVVYVSLCMILLHFYGLMGFCLGVLFAKVIKLLVLLIIYNVCKPNAEEDTPKEKVLE